MLLNFGLTCVPHNKPCKQVLRRVFIHTHTWSCTTSSCSTCSRPVLPSRLYLPAPVPCASVTVHLCLHLCARATGIYMCLCVYVPACRCAWCQWLELRFAVRIRSRAISNKQASACNPKFRQHHQSRRNIRSAYCSFLPPSLCVPSCMHAVCFWTRPRIKLYCWS